MIEKYKEENIKRGKERKQENERKRVRERDIFWLLYTGYLLSIVKIKTEI